MVKQQSNKISFKGVGIVLIIILFASIAFGVIYFDAFRTTEEAGLLVDKTWLVLIIIEMIAIIVIFIGNDRRTKYL